MNPWEGHFITPCRSQEGHGALWFSGGDQMKEKTAPNSNSLYPRHLAPGRGWRQSWRQSRWSAASGWRLWGTCWGCWCPSSPNTSQMSPGARRPEPRPRGRGRAAAAVAGAGFSPVPSGTAGAGAAAADACSGERNTHPDQGSRSSQGNKQAGREAPCGRERGAPYMTPRGGMGPVRRRRRQNTFNDWRSLCQLRVPSAAYSPH